MVDEEQLKGKIGTISPVVRDNKLMFDVYLEEASHSNLLPNLKVDLKVVTESRDSVLRIKKGSVFGNGPHVQVYMVQDQVARMLEVETGLEGSLYIELIDGANEGDVLIISEVPAFKNQVEVPLQ